MAYVVDRVVVCDAFQEPDKHYQLLPGGRSRLAAGRRPSMRFLASAKDVRGGISGVVGKETGLFDDLSAAAQRQAIQTGCPQVSETRIHTKGWPLSRAQGSSEPLLRCAQLSCSTLYILTLRPFVLASRHTRDGLRH